MEGYRVCLFFQELGIHKVGHLKRIQQGIKDIKAKMSVLDKTATVL